LSFFHLVILNNAQGEEEKYKNIFLHRSRFIDGKAVET
jgi:hypothetical protein